MPVTHAQQDLDNLTLTITAEFAAPVQRIWSIYADPRQLEKVWGPPTYPATFVEHQLTPGGRTAYYMTGPEGEKYAGCWDITAVENLRSFTFVDYFADEEFKPDLSLPASTNVYTFAEHGSGTRATYVSKFESVEALQKVLDMGALEGTSLALNQIDKLIAG